MKDLGILMTPGNIVAIDEERKTMTRWLSGLNEINTEPDAWSGTGNVFEGEPGPFYNEGTGFWHFLHRAKDRILEVKAPYAVGQHLYIKEPHFRYGKWVKNKYGYKGKDCKAYVQSSGKCKIKVPTRYNDYCEEDDCPRNKRRGLTKTGKQAWKFKVLATSYSVATKRRSFGPVFFDDTIPTELPVRKNSYRKSGWYKRSPLFMPKKFARTCLEVTKVYAPERVQDITEDDAVAEGIDATGLCRCTDDVAEGVRFCINCNERLWDIVDEFRLLWDSIHGKDKAKSWEANPWVWPIEFKKIVKGS